VERIYCNIGTKPDRQIPGHNVRTYKETISQGTSKPFKTTPELITPSGLPHQHWTRVPHTAARSELTLRRLTTYIYIYVVPHR
jgi:hypothetical protein